MNDDGGTWKCSADIERAGGRGGREAQQRADIETYVAAATNSDGLFTFFLCLALK